MLPSPAQEQLEGIRRTWQLAAGSWQGFLEGRKEGGGGAERTTWQQRVSSAGGLRERHGSGPMTMMNFIISCLQWFDSLLLLLLGTVALGGMVLGESFEVAQAALPLGGGIDAALVELVE